MAKYLSGRVKRTPQSRLTDDRYTYLGLEQAEPNLGDPIFAQSPLPAGQQYQLVSVIGSPGERFWIPVLGGTIPGAISIYDENQLVGVAASISQLSFVGAAITVTQNGTYQGNPITTTGDIAAQTSTITGIDTTGIQEGYEVINQYVPVKTLVDSIGTNQIDLSLSLIHI